MPVQGLDHVHFLTIDADATVKFYCEIIGLKLGDSVSIDSARTLYFYIDGVAQPVLHIGKTNIDMSGSAFSREASLNKEQARKFSTGSFDHFCLLIDFEDYDLYIDKFTQKNIDFQTYCNPDTDIKQIWLLDPSGVRVELGFVKK